MVLVKSYANSAQGVSSFLLKGGAGCPNSFPTACQHIQLLTNSIAEIERLPLLYLFLDNVSSLPSFRHIRYSGRDPLNLNHTSSHPSSNIRNRNSNPTLRISNSSNPFTLRTRIRTCLRALSPDLIPNNNNYNNSSIIVCHSRTMLRRRTIKVTTTITATTLLSKVQE